MHVLHLKGSTLTFTEVCLHLLVITLPLAALTKKNKKKEPLVKGGVRTGAHREVASMASWPDMTSSVVATSSTERAIGPMQSREDANASRPYRGTRPYVGFRPTQPLKCAGSRTDPPAYSRTVHCNSSCARKAHSKLAEMMG